MNRLRELRLDRGLTMKEAAKALGLPYTTYINYEKGYREPHSETLIKFAEYFGVTLDCLLGNDGQVAKDELEELVAQIRTRPEIRSLVHLATLATKEDVEKSVRVLEAIMGHG